MPLFDALKYGTIGLCAVLMFFAYHLLGKEQQATEPRAEIIHLIRLFMFLAVASMGIGLFSQLPIFRSGSVPVPATSPDVPEFASGFGPDFFTGTWEVTDAHDVKSDNFAYTPRYSYSGDLRGHVEGNEFVMSGELIASDINNTKRELGRAKWNFRGPVNNNEVAGSFSYTRADVNGFGTCYMQFDGGGNAIVHMIARVTRPDIDKKEGNIALVILHLVRAS